MKKIKVVSMALLVSCISVFSSCDFEEISSGINLALDAKFITPIVSVTIIDGSLQRDLSQEAISVKAVGQDADKLITLAGEKSLEIAEGILDLGVENINIPTPDNPLKFTLVFELEGYLKSQQSYEIYDDSTFVSTISMVNVATPPDGVTTVTATATIGSDGLEETLTLETPSSGDKAEQLTLVMEQGTQLLNAQGQPLTGTAFISVAHFGSEQDESLESFPGGMVVSGAVDGETGDVMEDGVFTTVGFVEIDINVDGEAVKSFSKPLRATMDISAEMLNPDTGEPVRAGDIIPAWSLDDEGKWTMESEPTVFEDGGVMKLAVEIPHLSYWNLDYYGTRCSSQDRTVINIVSDISQSSFPSNYFYIEIYNARTNRRFTYGRQSSRLYNGENITIFAAPRNTPIYFKIYEKGSSWWTRGDLLYTTPVFNTCETSTLNLTGQLNFDPPLLIKTFVEGLCTVEESSVRPSGYIYYKDPNSSYPYWRFLTYMRGGHSWIDKLEAGSTYDFYFRYGNRSGYFFNGITVEDQTFDFGNMSITIDIPENGGFYYMTFDGIELPRKYCEDIF